MARLPLFNRSRFAAAAGFSALALAAACPAQADGLDDVHAFLDRHVDGRTMYRESATDLDGVRTRTENWFVMTNVARSADLVTYEILYTARTVASRAGSDDATPPRIDTETAHFYCRLGRRASTGRVLGYCAPDASTDRPIDGKAWTLVATLESPSRLVLDEEITLYQDVPDPAAGGAPRPGAGTSRIAIERGAAGLVMTETARRWAVDPLTLARRPSGPAMELVSRELRLTEAASNATGAPREAAADRGSAELDRVHAWFATRIVGRELTWVDDERGVQSWFTISNVYRSGSEMQYEILYRSRRPERTADGEHRVWRMEQVHWSCRLGARKSTGDVLGFCRTLAATDRDLVAKASAIAAAVRGETLELRESTVDFIDVRDPRTGALVPGATESRIVIGRDAAGRLQMSETAAIYRVDPVTRVRTVIRPPATITLREQPG